MKIVDKRVPTSSNEIEILRRISHPNIVNIYEIFEDSKKYYKCLNSYPEENYSIQ